jgi:starch-binding outer membrane protein, SusD/RagB family
MKTKNILFLLIAILTFSSCEDWLTVEPLSTKPIGGASYSDAVASVNGIYAYLRAPYNKTGYATMAFSSLEVQTGQYFPDAFITQETATIETYNLQYTRSNSNYATFWSSFYGGIEASNIAISSIPNIDDVKLTEDEKSRLLGEARFLRAYYYFALVQLFGDIPMKTEPTVSPADGQIGKTSIKDIYEKLIVPDLQFAEASKMPLKSGEGRVSIGAAKSLLAKVYLTMAGYPLMQTDKYALAKTKAGEVINSNSYTLFQSDANRTWFEKLNNSDYDNKEEHIFMVQYLINQVNSSMSIYLAPVGGVGKITVSTLHFGGLRPTTQFYDSYASGDLRAQEKGFFFSQYPDKSGTPVVTFDRSVYKYFDKYFIQTAPNGNKNQPLIRYADILLVYAEAQNAADGSPNTAAYNAINSIRQRSGLANLAGLSKQAFEEAVWKERAWELTCEGHVWFDMKRTQKAFNGTTFVNLVGYTTPNSKTYTQENLYFPIPQSEIDVNPLLGE